MIQILAIVLAFVVTDIANAELFRRRGNTSYSSSQGSRVGGYANCYDYVQRTGGVGSPVANSMSAAQPGDVLEMRNFSWNGMTSPRGLHYARVESINGDTMTISHSNFNGNHGRVVHTLPISNFRGSVTVRR
jgi:hypothetical protein